MFSFEWLKGIDGVKGVAYTYLILLFEHSIENNFITCG